MQKYYRPEWTCGRYNKEKEVALMYNLIEGMSYLFEDYSAEVIDKILSVNKNGFISIDDVSSQTLIDKESLISFFMELMEFGLLVPEVPTKQSIDIYRKKTKENSRKYSSKIKEDSLSQNLSSVEQDYANKVGGITNVMFELTYNCSEKCIHCYNPGATRNDEERNKRGDRIELELHDYIRIIDELYDLGLTRVCLSGGDPFSKSEIWEILDYLYKKGIAVDILTNGQSIVNKISVLANYYPNSIGVSIYSGIEEEHDFITKVKGSWRRSINVIEQLSELGIPINLKCCIMVSNIKSYHLVKDIASKYNASLQFTVALINSLEGDVCVNQHLYLPNSILEIVLRDRDVSQYVGDGKPNFGEQKIQESPTCDSYCITPEGHVQVCCVFPCSFGNLKDQKFLNIVNNNKELAWWRNTKLEQYEDCGKHDYCNYCKICPGTNFSETGNPLKSAKIKCNLAQVRFELAQKLKKNNDPLNDNSVQDILSKFDYQHSIIQQENNNNNYRTKKLQVGG